MLTTTMGICYGFSAISYLFRLQPPHAGNYIKQLMFHYRRTHNEVQKNDQLQQIILFLYYNEFEQSH